MSNLLISFYGDDFTGSTDALESLARSGVRTVLFTRPPSREQLARYADIRAFGIAGTTRAMSPDAMEAELRPALVALRESGAPIVHYKVCSTFDSSPAVGSIGRVIDVGMDVFGSTRVPVVVGAPSLGRHCVFGNLFARSGAESEPFRLDRHPSMSRHPITPMDEADLRLHLGRQTAKSIGLLDVLKLEQPDVLEQFERIGEQIVLIDLLYERQLATVGKLLERCAKPLFTVGSSGVESALAARWHETGVLQHPGAFKSPRPNGPIVAVCGSCSPVTARQIQHAVSSGFVEFAIDPRRPQPDRVVAECVRSLGQNRSVVIHTGMGRSENRVDPQTARQIGPMLGALLREILSQAPIRRVIVAGGDTSGAVARGLGIESMEMAAELTRGAPLCKAVATGSPADGIEITFKGGQIGKESFFSFVLHGKE